MAANIRSQGTNDNINRPRKIHRSRHAGFSYLLLFLDQIASGPGGGDNYIQRPPRGSRVFSFYPVKNIQLLSSLERAFQLQEYISLLIRLDVHDVDSIVALPVDHACWVYEQLRRPAQNLSHPLITMCQQDCTWVSYAEMKAREWLYLWVAHGNDGAMEQCCAIDYILHTLDSANALLNSPRAFPSRYDIITTIALNPPDLLLSFLPRAPPRTHIHAYFHHREAFEQVEAESSLYSRFLRLTAEFELVPSEFPVILESAVVNHHHHDGRMHTEEMGRSWADTMVFSEGYHVAEEIAKGASPSQGSTILLDNAPPPFTAFINAQSLTTDPHSPTWTRGRVHLEEIRPQVETTSEEEPAPAPGESEPTETIAAEGTDPETETAVPSSDPEPESKPESLEDKPTPISDAVGDAAEVKAAPIPNPEAETPVRRSQVSASISAPEPPQEQQQNPDFVAPIYNNPFDAASVPIPEDGEFAATVDPTTKDEQKENT
ncbi:Mob1/phocein [Hygrophoropsis aurantiaca]|uniref:Mob1/phocein n=1 Tax=Hygrophoropsis aurantiaca TaxID=72124 RepID=A0ACB8ADI9_9AGAM|nr:Mob1/phocein [Hygrophoropsis aurantiaca]